MKLFVMAIRDRALDAYGTPMFMQAIGQGVRAFTDEVNREAQDNQYFQHPEDFDLYHVAMYDTDTGLFEQEAVRQVAIGKDVSQKSSAKYLKAVSA